MRIVISVKQIALFAGITLLMFLTFFFIVSPLIPDSRFYKNDVKKLQRQIEMHKRTALKALQDYRSYLGSKGPVFNKHDAKRLCVSIASVRREKVKYLEQTIATLLTRAPLSLQDRVRITLYNLHHPAEDHAVALGMKDLVRVRTASYLSVDPEAGPIDKRRVKRKEFLDYIALLEAEEKRQCDYYLVLEDDVLAAKDWATQALAIIEEAERREAKGERFSKIKLFSDESFANDGYRWTRPLDIAAITLLVTVLTAAIYGSMLCIANLAKRKKSVDKETTEADKEEVQGSTIQVDIRAGLTRLNWIAAVFLAGCMLFMVLIVGRRTVFPAPRGLQEGNIVYLYQANLYSHDAMGRWTRFLRRVYFANKAAGLPLQPKDNYVKAFNASQKKDGGKEYMHMIWRPSVFQHTGIESSIGNNRTLHTAQISHSFPDDDLPIIFDKRYIEA
jgi:hypothetical protein